MELRNYQILVQTYQKEKAIIEVMNRLVEEIF